MQGRWTAKLQLMQISHQLNSSTGQHMYQNLTYLFATANSSNLYRFDFVTKTHCKQRLVVDRKRKRGEWPSCRQLEAEAEVVGTQSRCCGLFQSVPGAGVWGDGGRCGQTQQAPTREDGHRYSPGTHSAGRNFGGGRRGSGGGACTSVHCHDDLT